MLRGAAWLGAGFILLPTAIILISSISELRTVTFPPTGFTWAWYGVALGRPEFLDSFRISVTVAALAAGLSVVIGVLGALTIRSLPAAARGIAMTLALSPLVLPGVVTGIALLQFFSLAGLDVSLVSLVLGHVVITTPYVIRLVSDSLSTLPRNLDWAAAGLGASPAQTLLRVILPCIRSGIIGGGVFAFIVSFENVTISIFLASPQLTTLPVRVFGYTEQAIETWLVAICSLTIVFSLLLVVLIERAIGLRRVFQSGRA